MGDFTDDAMLSYVIELYTHKGVQNIECDIKSSLPSDMFNLATSKATLNKMSNGKAYNTLHLNAKLLKWTTQETRLALLRVIHLSTRMARKLDPIFV